MNKLQMKYNILHFFYWVATCSVYGYTAVFLQYKGMSNTEIGLVTGIGCVTTIFLSPFVSSLIGKIKGLTIRKLYTFIFIVIASLFSALALIDLPVVLIMVFYFSMMSLIVTTVPLLSSVAMNYIKEGKPINFGLARGIGSVAYAISAVMLGQLIDFFNPTVLALVFVIAAIASIVMLFILPESKIETPKVAGKKTSVFTIIKKYRTFFCLLLGFTFMFGASTTLSTYLINVVKNLGGNTGIYGIAIFFMAASEMPVMALVPRLMKKFDSVTLIMVAACFYILRNFIICLAPSLPILFVGMAMQSFSYGLLTGVITYYVTFNLHENDQMMGQTMIGIMTSGLGSTIGNVFGGVLQDSFGIDVMFIFACTITVIGVIIIWVTGLKEKGKILV